jgi:hypothetical protein|eukprot:COSAG02_NODE_3051_length_7468_cov_2.280092_5_plen_44_part_00
MTGPWDALTDRVCHDIDSLVVGGRYRDEDRVKIAQTDRQAGYA